MTPLNWPESPGRVRAYDWLALPTLSRSELREQRRLRQGLAAVDRGRLAASLRELGAYDAVEFGLALGPRLGPTARVDLAFRGGLVRLALEPAGAVALVSRVLGHVVNVDSGKSLEPGLEAAFGAVVVEALRRATIGEPPQIAAVGEHEPRLRFDYWVSLDRRAFNGYVEVLKAPASGTFRRPLAQVPVCLPLVVGLSSLTVAELESLRVGDVWMVGAGLWIDDKGWGRRLGVAQNGTLGLSFHCAQQTICKKWMRLPGANAEHEEEEWPMTDDGVDAKEREQQILDAPLTVRLEMGSATLSAADWLSLREGDVLETGLASGGPITLRVAGRVVASGDLVVVDGELGVRITRLSPPEKQD